MQIPQRYAEGNYLTVPMAMQYFNLSRSVLMKLASESGTIMRFGRTVRIDRARLQEYYTKNYSFSE